MLHASLLDTSMPLAPVTDAGPSAARVSGPDSVWERLQPRTDASNGAKVAAKAAPTRIAAAPVAGKTATAVAAEAAPTNAVVGTAASVPDFVGAASAASVQVPTQLLPAASAGGIGGAVTALTVVIALILALAWLARRMPVLGGGAGSNPALRIVGSLALGPRERVVVVAVGDTQLLLGVGAGGTRTLHTLSEPLPVAASTTPAFAQLLAQHFGKKA